MLRALLVGAGMMGQNHARVLSGLDGVRLVAIVDAPGYRPQATGDFELLDSLDEFDPTTVDFAVVATPTSTHEEIVMRLMSFGIHVLVEKPIAHSAQAGRRMAKLAAQKRLVGAVGHIERYNPAIQELKKRLGEGTIGEVYQIATRRQGSFPARVADVGVSKDLATHDFDITGWVSKSPYELIFSQALHKSGREHEDLLSVTGRLRNGVIVNHLVNWMSPMKERVVIVTGDKGTFVADTVTGDLTLHENGAFSVEWDSFATFRGVTEGNITRFAYPKKEPLKAELEAFRDAVLGHEAAIVTFQEGVDVLRVAEAAVRSAGSGIPERL